MLSLSSVLYSSMNQCAVYECIHSDNKPLDPNLAIITERTCLQLFVINYTPISVIFTTGVKSESCNNYYPVMINIPLAL